MAVADSAPVLRHHPADEPKCTLLTVPGYADHAGRYIHVGEYFAANSVDFYALDVTGHGKASGRRGHIDSFADYRRDVVLALEEVRRNAQGSLFLLGHSLGGLIVSSTMLHDEPQLAGVLLSSPFLGLSIPVSPSKRAVAGLLSGVWPTLTMPNNIPAGYLSRDQSVGQAYMHDPLVFRTATARWFTETIGAINEVTARAADFTQPIAVFQAGNELIADKVAVAAFYGRLGSHDKMYREYPGFYHEILNEIGKEQVLSDMLRWIEERRA